MKDEGFRKWLTTWSALLALVVSAVTLLGLIFKGGNWTSGVDQKLVMLDTSVHELADEVTEHSQDRDLHMTYEKKVERFVLRQEWLAAQANRDRQLLEIKDSTRRVEDRVEKIYELLQRN